MRSLSLEQARALALKFGRNNGATSLDHLNPLERPGYWFIPVGNFGTSGVLVDKSSGKVTPLGSGYPVDLQMWAHERGLLGLVALRVTRVYDLEASIEFFLYLEDDGPPRTPNPNPRRAWLRERLTNLPCEWPRQWLSLPAIREAAESVWFEFEPIGE